MSTTRWSRRWANRCRVPRPLHSHGETYDDPQTPFVIATGLGLVDFAVLPLLDHAEHPESSTANVARMAAAVPVPLYAMDDATAIKVTDGPLEVVSEGHWQRFTPYWKRGLLPNA